MFSVRLVVADHYMSPPIPELDVRYSEFRGTEVKQVPVIRIFGSTVVGMFYICNNFRIVVCEQQNMMFHFG